MALFHKNAVITGLLDSYCLPCEIYLKSDDEIKRHIEESNHKNLLASTNFVEKYKEDGIRKVKQGYYCEYCNKLLVTVIKVDMHVFEKEHKDIKNVKQLQLRDNAVVAFNKIAFDEDAWHGVVDGSCALCNIDFLDKEAHKNTPTHLLRLVQSNVELDSDGAVYRKGDNFFYCLICNALFALNALKTHLENSDHVKFYNKCCETYNTKTSKNHLSNINANQIIEIECEIKNNNENNAKGSFELTTSNEQAPEVKDSNGTINSPQVISDSNTSVQSEEAKINSNKKKNKSKAMTKESSVPSTEIVTVAGNHNESEHDNAVAFSLSNNNQNAEVEIPKNLTEEAKHFAKTHQIRYEGKANSAFCSICNITISSTFKRMKEHVGGKTHKTNAGNIYEVLSDTQSVDEFVNRKDFIKFALFTGISLKRSIDVVINKSICISALSFMLITGNQTSRRCHLCEENVNVDLIEFHCNLSRHMSALNSGLVLCSLLPDFVRQVRPGLYHCGFCNIIEDSWSRLTDHLKSITHNRKKEFACERLQDHLPDIAKKDFNDFLRHILF